MKGIFIAAGVILLVYIFFESRSATATPAGAPATAPPPAQPNIHGAAVGLQSLESPGALPVNTTAAVHACAGCAVSPTSNAIMVGRFGMPSRASALPAPPRLAVPLTAYHPASLEAPISHFDTRKNASIIQNKTQTRIGWGA